MTRIGIIYCATNIITGEVYIGQTNNYAKRLKEHIKYSLNKNRREYHVKFHQAIREYGYDKFKWTILYSGIPEEYIDIMEKWVIYNYNSFENGYNSHPGGRSINRKLSGSNI